MSLRVVSGPGAGQEFEVGEGVVIGRDEGLDLGGDPELSRRHARVARGPGGELLVEDLGSTNGTLVNGHRISAATPVRAGDRIEVGGSVLEVAGEVAPAGVQTTRAAPVPQAAQQRPARPGTAPAPAGAAPLPAGLGAAAHPAEGAKKGSKAPVAIAALVLGLIIGGAIALVVSEDDEGAGSGASGESFDGTLYTLSNGFAPKYTNSVLAYRTSEGSLLPMRLSEYPTGGTGARNINLNLAIDGEQELTYDAERDLLFAVNPGSDSVAVFEVASDGTLTAVEGSPFPSGGVAPISTGVAGDTLLVVNKGHDGVRQVDEEVATVAQLEIGEDGGLSPTGEPIPVPNGTNPTQVLVTRGGDLAVVTLERGNHYVTLMRQEDGTFREAAKTPITDEQRAIGGPGGPPGGGGPPPAAGGGGPPAGGGGPPAGGGGPPPAGGGGPPAGGGAPQLGSIPEGALGMTEHPDAPVIYSELPNYSLLMVHEYDDSGALKFVRGVPIPKGFLACWAKVSADGRFLYVANTGEHTIAVFDVSDPRNPKHLQSHPVPGPGGVASIQIDDEAKALYALDHFDPLDLQPGDSNRLHAFRIGADGRLSGGDEGSLKLPVGPDVSPIGAQWLAQD